MSYRLSADLIGSLKTLSVNVERASYLLQNGGPRALLAAIGRRYAFRRSSSQVEEAAISLSDGCGEIDKLAINDAAKLRREEVVLFADRPFEWQAGHHRGSEERRAAADRAREQRGRSASAAGAGAARRRHDA